MPKKSKISSPVSTRPKKPTVEEERRDFYCCRCKRHHTKLRTNYPATQSPIFKGNGGYLPICNHCIDDLYEHYKETLGDDRAAMMRICLKFDIYWSDDIYRMVYKENTSKSRMRSYISKTNLYAYIGKSFDDTLDEMESEENKFINSIPETNTDIIDDGVVVSPEIVEFWGTGFEPEFYLELDRKYKYWTNDLKTPPDKGEEAIYKQVCILEATINRDSAAGRSIEKHVNSLNTLLGSANLKPSQKKTEDASDAAFDGLPFGVGIRAYENSRPIPKPDPELQDVDGIIKYISVWFLGHLCKMIGIKNSYCKMYERELERMRVERPDITEEDDEVFFDEVFGGEA